MCRDRLPPHFLKSSTGYASCSPDSSKCCNETQNDWIDMINDLHDVESHVHIVLVDVIVVLASVLLEFLVTYATCSFPPRIKLLCE